MDSSVDIIVLLDESGSMSSMGKEPVDSINEFIRDQKAIQDNSTFSLYTFNSRLKHVWVNVRLQDVGRFEYDQFNPASMTALYDAMGQVMDNKKNSSRNRNVVMVILTDGEENSSKEYNKQTINKMTNALKSYYNWRFVYLGANQDSFLTGGGLGIDRNTCRNYTTQSGGMTNATKGCSLNVSNYRQKCASEPTKTHDLTM